MIDPSIITRGAERAQMQQQQNFESLGDLGNSLGRMVLGRRINTLQQLTTPEEKQAYANKSIYAPQLNAQIKADNAAALQAQMIQQKHLADIGNTNAQAAERNSNAGKNIQQGVGFSLDNSGKQLGAIKSAWLQSAQTGDAGAAVIALDSARRTGLITPEDYNQQVAIIKQMSPDQVKQYAQSVALAESKDPSGLFYTTANNRLDNETSIKNNVLNNQTTQRGQDISAETSRYGTDVNANLAQQKMTLEQAKLEYEQKKGTVQQFGDNMYMVYPDGRAVPISNPTGQAVTKTTVSPAIKQAQQEDAIRTQRVDAVLPDIKKLLEGTKGGYINAGLDWLGGAAGYSTDTAKTTAQLKALSGQLVALMPKMSGPQSDKDVAMYKEMAGNLADPATPVPTRLAALETIQALNDKYKSLNGSQAQGVPYANTQGGSTQGGLSGAQSQGLQSLISKYTVN